MENEKVQAALLKICKTAVPDVDSCYSLVERLQDFVEEIDEAAHVRGLDLGHSCGFDEGFTTSDTDAQASFDVGYESGYDAGYETGYDDGREEW